MVWDLASQVLTITYVPFFFPFVQAQQRQTRTVEITGKTQSEVVTLLRNIPATATSAAASDESQIAEADEVH